MTRTYEIINEAWYAKANPPRTWQQGGVTDTIAIAYGDDEDRSEFRVEWRVYQSQWDRPSLWIDIAHDAFPAFTILADFFAEVAKWDKYEAPSMADFLAILHRLGFEDVTERGTYNPATGRVEAAV